MKTLKISVALLLLFVIKTSAQQVATVEMQVTGLTCSMCSQATEKSLRTLNYISNVTPDLNKNLFVITFKKDQAVNFDQLQKKVKDAGFSVGKLSATIKFNDVKVDDKGQAIVGGNAYQFLNLRSKTLTGAIKADVVDKNFISSKAFKQKAGSVNIPTYKTGYGVVNGKKTRIYHLSLS